MIVSIAPIENLKHNKITLWVKHARKAAHQLSISSYLCRLCSCKQTWSLRSHQRANFQSQIFFTCQIEGKNENNFDLHDFQDNQKSPRYSLQETGCKKTWEFQIFQKIEQTFLYFFSLVLSFSPVKSALFTYKQGFVINAYNSGQKMALRAFNFIINLRYYFTERHLLVAFENN